MHIRIDGETYETTNWSFGGFLLERCSVEREYGSAISGTLGWNGVRFPFIGRVTRSGGDEAALAVSFTDISEAALLFLDRCLSDFIAGKKRAAT